MRTAIVALFVVAIGLWVSVLPTAQTGQVMPPPKFEAWDSSGNPCNGCKLYAYAAGTTTPQNTYTTSALSVANENPVVLDGAGRATVFVDPTLSYKFTLKTSADVDIWTVDNVVGPFSGVVSITAANTRGLQISRSSAEAGLSIASTGGSGKTYGLVSNTSGVSQWRDDADGTPRAELSGNDINLVATGTVTVSGAVLAGTGFGTQGVSAGSTGGNIWQVRNTSAGTGNYAQVQVGNDGSATALRLAHTSTTYTTAAPYVQDAAVLEGTRAGGLSLVASHANGDIRLYTNGTLRMSILDNGGVGIGTTPTHDLQLLSTADDLTGGLRIDRSDNSYLIANINDSAGGGVLQAGDGSTYRALALSPSGGGIAVGGGTAILSIITGTASWNPALVADGSMVSTTVTVTGVQASSPCIPGYFPQNSGGGTPVDGMLLSAYYESANTVRVVMFNKSGGNVDAASNTLRVTCLTY